VALLAAQYRFERQRALSAFAVRSLAELVQRPRESDRSDHGYNKLGAME
jgi:hypothetical protein